MRSVLLFLAILPLLAFPAAAGDLSLTLVNPWTPLPAGWQVTLTDVGGGHRVDKACAADLNAMLSACRAAGFSPLICSSYRTQSTQQYLFDRKVGQMEAKGLRGESARQAAAAIVAPPGTSEHQLGWAVDIVDKSYQVLDEKQANTPAQKWLMAHCWEFGFLLRYPADKQAVTGIIHEPWHYRWVGRENARAIQKTGLCLEEYLPLHRMVEDAKTKSLHRVSLVKLQQKMR